VICLGERHDSVPDHAAQLAVLEGLLERRELRGFELGLGLEMVESVQQPVLEKFSRGRLSLLDLPEALDWPRTWGFSFELFREQLEEVPRRGVVPLALNLPKPLARRIAEVGVDSLKPKETEQLPELTRDVPRHRALFDELMQGHPSGSPEELERYYLAQVARDDQMAEIAVQWVKARRSLRKLVIVAGVAHCHDSALPLRIRSRLPLTVVSVLPAVTQAEEGTVAEGYDYQLIFGDPLEPSGVEPEAAAAPPAASPGAPAAD